MDERDPGLQLLDDDAPACRLLFRPVGKMYQPTAALAILASLHAREFTGLCECYLRPGARGGEYWMGVGLLSANDAEPLDDSWWASFVDNAAAACEDDDEVRLVPERCEPVPLADLRATMVHAGTAGFVDGAADWISDPAGPDPDSPFSGLVRRIYGPESDA